MIRKDKNYQPVADARRFGERVPGASCVIHGKVVRVRGCGTLYCALCETIPWIAQAKQLLREKRL